MEVVSYDVFGAGVNTLSVFVTKVLFTVYLGRKLFLTVYLRRTLFLTVYYGRSDFLLCIRGGG